MIKKLCSIALLGSAFLVGCPACVGRIAPESPPFFSNTFYTPHAPDQSVQEPQHEEQFNSEEKGSDYE